MRYEEFDWKSATAGREAKKVRIKRRLNWHTVRHGSCERETGLLPILCSNTLNSELNFARQSLDFVARLANRRRLPTGTGHSFYTQHIRYLSADIT